MPLNASNGVSIGSNATVSSGMGVDAPFGTAVVRLVNQNSGGNVQLVAPNGSIAIYSGGVDVLDVTSTGASAIKLTASTSGVFDGSNRVYSASNQPDTILPVDHGYKVWNYDPVNVTAGTALSSGVMFLQKVSARSALTLSNATFYVTTAATTPTSGQNFVALYDSTGTRRAVSADMSTSLTSTGLKTIAFSAAYSAPAGFYWVAILNVASTPMQVARNVASGLPTLKNAGLTAATARWATSGSALTATPATITPASNTLTGTDFWVACS